MILIRVVGFDAGFAFALTGGWLILMPSGKAVGVLTFLLGLVLMASAFR